MSRIELTDTTIDALTKMSDGNPGALTAMMEIMNKHDEIDPQGFMGGLGAIMLMDTWEIYGTDIYILYSDKCDKDVRRMLLLMRATQLGLFPQHKLNAMASDQSLSEEYTLSEEEWANIDKFVCDQLKDFQKVA